MLTIFCRTSVANIVVITLFPLKPDPNSAFGLTPHASRQKQYQQQQQYQTERKQRKFQFKSTKFHFFTFALLFINNESYFGENIDEVLILIMLNQLL